MFRMIMHSFKKYFYFLAQQNKGAPVDAMLKSIQEAQMKLDVLKKGHTQNQVGESGKSWEGRYYDQNAMYKILKGLENLLNTKSIHNIGFSVLRISNASHFHVQNPLLLEVDHPLFYVCTHIHTIQRQETQTQRMP